MIFISYCSEKQKLIETNRQKLIKRILDTGSIKIAHLKEKRKQARENSVLKDTTNQKTYNNTGS